MEVWGAVMVVMIGLSVLSHEMTEDLRIEDVFGDVDDPLFLIPSFCALGALG